MWQDKFVETRDKLKLQQGTPVGYHFATDSIAPITQRDYDLAEAFNMAFGPLVSALVKAARKGELVLPPNAQREWNKFASSAAHVAEEFDAKWLEDVPKL